VISGLGYLYQGVGGAASTVVIGLPFGLLFLLTGNLAVLRHLPDRSAVLRQTVFLSRYSRRQIISARAQIMPFQNPRIPRQTCD
jgi:hypothetical protein